MLLIHVYTILQAFDTCTCCVSSLFAAYTDGMWSGARVLHLIVSNTYRHAPVTIANRVDDWTVTTTEANVYTQNTHLVTIKTSSDNLTIHNHYIVMLVFCFSVCTRFKMHVLVSIGYVMLIVLTFLVFILLFFILFFFLFIFGSAIQWPVV